MIHYRRLAMVSAATGIAAFLAGCATSDTALQAPTSAITSDAVAAPCAAGLPADAPKLTVADTQTGASLGQICEVTTRTDGSPSYQLIAAIADNKRRQQFLTLAPYDGQALPAGCTVSLRKRAYIQIKGAWHEFRDVGCTVPDMNATSPAG